MQIAISGKFSDDVADAAMVISDQLRDVIKSTNIADIHVELNPSCFSP